MEKKKTKSIGSDYGMVPPQDIDLEETIIGSLIVESSAIDRVENILKPECFYNDAFGKIYDCILQMHSKQLNIDLFILQNELKKTDALDQIGGQFALVQLMQKIGSTAHLENHALIIFEKYLKREVIRLGSELSKSGYDNSIDVEDLLSDLNQATEKLNNISVGNSDENNLKTIVNDCMNSLSDRMSMKDESIIDGIPTGLSSLDERIIGFRGGKLYVLAGRPGMGKTALMIAFTKASAKNDKRPVIFSLEMAKKEMGDRYIIGESNINSSKYERGNIDDLEFSKLEKSISTLENLKITIDDKPNISFRQIRSRARRLHKQGKCDILFIDYLQLINMSNGKWGENREQQVAQTTRDLKVLAKELNIPVILLAQLSRKVEDRPNKRPQNSDLRESGAIEQDADVILFAYRPEEYGMKDQNDNLIVGEGKIIIGKNRSGSKSDALFYYNESLTKITSEPQDKDLPF